MKMTPSHRRIEPISEDCCAKNTQFPGAKIKGKKYQYYH
jgi:hypothetical protein